jgi:hypothetical protein
MVDGNGLARTWLIGSGLPLSRIVKGYEVVSHSTQRMITANVAKKEPEHMKAMTLPDPTGPMFVDTSSKNRDPSVLCFRAPSRC